MAIKIENLVKESLEIDLIRKERLKELREENCISSIVSLGGYAAKGAPIGTTYIIIDRNPIYSN